jgi:hypothetical protein
MGTGTKRDMKSLLATLSLVAVLAACATPYAQREFDFSDLNGLAGLELGTVESVEVVRIERDIHAFVEALELRMQPDLAEQLVIRLDAGGAVTVMAEGTQRFRVGERVRVVSQTYSPYGPRVEHE